MLMNHVQHRFGMKHVFNFFKCEMFYAIKIYCCNISIVICLSHRRVYVAVTNFSVNTMAKSSTFFFKLNLRAAVYQLEHEHILKSEEQHLY